MAADLLVTDKKCLRSYTVQVKTNGKPAPSWLVGKKTGTLKSDTLLYVFVSLQEEGDHEFYVMPSADAARRMRTIPRPNSTWYAVDRKVVEPYWNAWEYFGKP